jgi:fluoroacetyl-CoA thioesterase
MDVSQMPIASGLTAEANVVVEDHLTADRAGDPGFRVLSMPAHVQLFEATSIRAIARYHEAPLIGSVGMRIDLKHIAATPVVIQARRTAKVIALDRHRASSTLVAHGEKEPIGKGIHKRFLADSAKLLAHVEANTD